MPRPQQLMISGNSRIYPQEMGGMTARWQFILLAASEALTQHRIMRWTPLNPSLGLFDPSQWQKEAPGVRPVQP